MKYLNKVITSRLEAKRKELNKLRPLPVSAVKKLQEKLRLEMTYNSNAIEGNSLTLKETFLVINEGVTVKGKPLKDHLETKDQYAALEYLYDLVDKDKQNTISEKLIRSIHQMVVQETEKEQAGKYRTANVFIMGAKHTPPDAFQVPQLMNGLIVWLKKNSQKISVIELAALFHHKIVSIHPFFDGNGRTARLAMNLILMRAGYPLAIILKNDRKKYYNVLAKADADDYSPLVNFIAQTIERSFDIYLKTLAPKKSKEKLISLTDLAKNAPYSAKYLNLLVRQGKIEAYKEGRNWLSSKESLDRYIKGRERKK
ncbi:MAG: Fic family protein [Candidatus Komeilibacteria bacterium]|nr:Fic family protein [Candidatus Komeilibacteria bacterium]